MARKSISPIKQNYTRQSEAMVIVAESYPICPSKIAFIFTLFSLAQAVSDSKPDDILHIQAKGDPKTGSNLSAFVHKFNTTAAVVVNTLASGNATNKASAGFLKSKKKALNVLDQSMPQPVSKMADVSNVTADDAFQGKQVVPGLQGSFLAPLLRGASQSLCLIVVVTVIGLTGMKITRTRSPSQDRKKPDPLDYIFKAQKLEHLRASTREKDTNSGLSLHRLDLVRW